MMCRMVEERTDKTRVLTLYITPRSREAIKPAELIQVSGHHELTLNARRAITILWHQAHLLGTNRQARTTSLGPGNPLALGLPPPAPPAS